MFLKLTHDLKMAKLTMVMKIILLYIVCESALICAMKPADDDVQFTSCEDILTAEKCKKLRDAAVDIGLSDSDVLNGLRDAYIQRETPQIDTFTKVIEYLDAIFMCRIFLTEAMCTRIQRIAADRNVPFHEAEVNMHANRAKGIKERDKLYAAVIKYLSNFSDEVFHDEPSMMCTDVLSEELCQKIKEKAAQINLEELDVVKGLTDAKLQGVKDAMSIYRKVEEYLTSLVECLSILDQEHCGAIKLIAMKERVPFREVERLLKVAASSGITDKGLLYQKVMAYLKTADDEQLEPKRDTKDMKDVKAAACINVLSAKECQNLKDFAHIVTLDESQVSKALADAMMQGATKSSDIVSKAKQFLEDRSYCNFIMDEQECKDIETAAETSRVPLHKVRVHVNGLYDRGVKNGKQLYTATMKFIQESTSLMEEPGCSTDGHTNKCMVLLKSVMQCLYLRIFSWKNGLKPNDVNMALSEACVGGPRKEIYKNTITLLRCRKYCKIGRVTQSCKKIHRCATKHEISQQGVKGADNDKKARNLVIGIRE